jgi:hypothetical protein
MTGTPSFERFDYLLRTNKHIERKLVFDVLSSVAQTTTFDDHWYLGFGSMWFGDFKLAHRRLGIDKMVSVEYSDHAPRAAFNRPFAGVKVEPGDCSEVIANMSAEQWAQPLIAWLDYDGRLSEDVVSDVDALLDRAQPNSVLIITVNGQRNTYRARNLEGRLIQRQETGIGVIDGILGPGCVPTRHEPQPTPTGAFTDVSEASFPEVLTEALVAYIGHRVVVSAREFAGQRLKFLPLYRLHHRDGADMVTVGGALVTEATERQWIESLARHDLLVDDAGRAGYCRLDLVPVTVKEKIVLDECLPDGDGAAYIAAARAAGVALSEVEMAKYRKFYRHFPVFVETTM